jgi:glutamate racemase
VLRDARERYQGIPLVEVIYPAMRRAVKATRNNRIGVIGTRATIASRAYDDAFAAATHLSIHSAACPRFVEFVEAGITSGQELLSVAHSYLEPLKAADVDTLVLGCTHYPLLTGVLSYVMGEGVTLVSSAEETAKDVYRMLLEYSLMREPDLPRPRHHFMATGDPDSFAVLGRRFLGPEIVNVEQAHGVAL